MKKISVSRGFGMDLAMSERVRAVMRMFGVGMDRLRDKRSTHQCTLEVEDGDIVYITGPSGAGKSVLLREMREQVAEDERVSIEDIDLPADKAVIDCIGVTAEHPSTPLRAGAENAEKADIEINKESSANSAVSAVGLTTMEAMSVLGYAGLSEVFCVLAEPANLSEGQKYRFRLASALAAGRRNIFADEFCSTLDRLTAMVIAYNVRRFAKQRKVTFFLASSHEDILADLQPDVLVVKQLSGEAEVIYKKCS